MVYDCFQFFNELDILKIRLNVMNDVVDKFVISEATETFSGLKKPLYYEDYKDMNTKEIAALVRERIQNTIREAGF